MKKTTVVLTMSVLYALTLSAKIVTHPQKASPGDWYLFRTTIYLDKAPTKNTELSITADTKYWLKINGECEVFEGGLKQGPSPKSFYTDVHRSFKHLKKGENQIEILLWFFGKEGFSHKNSSVAGIDFQLKNGKQVIESDNSWQVARHPAYYVPKGEIPNYRLPESNIGYDARLTNIEWKQAIEISNSLTQWAEREERPIPQWKDFGLKEYSSVKKEGKRMIAQLPYNAQITPYLKIRSKGGDTIDIRTDNYRGGGPVNVYAQYVTKAGEQEYESLGWMNGHYVYYTISEGVEVLELKYRETGYNTEFTGSFSCNDDALNTLWKKSQRTLYITMRDTYMDCPDRERAQWWGDVVNELGEAFYALDSRAHLLTRKGILELMNWQREDGTIYSPVPAGNWDKELPMQMLASVGYYGFWTYYMGSGDQKTLSQVYLRVKKYLTQVWQVNDNGLVIPREVGWTWGDWGQNKDMELLFNQWYAIALDGLYEMATLLNYPEDAKWAKETSDKLKKVFHQTYWNGNYYISKNYTGKPDDRAQALAVVSGTLPSTLYPTIRPFFKQQYHASPYMEKYVLEALCRMNYEEDALERIRYRYKGMIESSYTTLYELWNIKPNLSGGSNNHAWSGGPLTILSQYIAGITPIEPKFKEFQVKPNLAGLEWIRTTVPTEYGSIELYVDQSKVELVVPRKTKAKLIWQGKELTLKPGKHIVKK